MGVYYWPANTDDSTDHPAVFPEKSLTMLGPVEWRGGLRPFRSGTTAK